MIKNFELRISKLEKELQNKYDEKSPCYGYTFLSTATDDEIIKTLTITPKEFTKWKKGRDNLGRRMIFTPNWSVEKYILQLQNEELNESF
jgi:hypothetical protein